MPGLCPGEFDTPDSIAIDSRGPLFVADLMNNRIQIFDQDRRYLTEWKQFGMPGGVFIDKNDVLYVADSLSSPDRHAGWIRGIRIGSARDGTITALIPDPTPNVDPITAAEGVAAVLAAVALAILDLYLTGQGHLSVLRPWIDWPEAGVHLSRGDVILYFAACFAGLGAWFAANRHS